MRNHADFGDGRLVVYKPNVKYFFQSTDRGATFSSMIDLPQNGATNSDFVYGHPAVEPDLFNFPEMNDLAINVTVSSNLITITGISIPLGVYVSDGAEVSITGGGGWQAGWGAATVSNNDTVQVRMSTATIVGVEKTTTVRIGTRKEEWTTSTAASSDLMIADAPAVTEGGTLEFVVSLAQTNALDVTFGWTTYDLTADGSFGDYSVSSGSRTIAAGASAITILIETYDINFADPGNESMRVSLSGESSNANMVDPVGIGTILDNDTLYTDPVVAVFMNGTNDDAILISEDLVNFQLVDVSELAHPQESIAYCGGQWLTYHETNNFGFLTSDFVSFSEVTIGSSPDYVICSEDRWITSDNGESRYSDDGITWVAANSTPNGLEPFVYRGNIYVPGYNGFEVHVSSDNGASYSTVTLANPGAPATGLYGVITGENDRLIIGETDLDLGGHYYSEDELNSVVNFSLSGATNNWAGALLNQGRLQITTYSGHGAARYTDNYATIQTVGGDAGTLVGGGISWVEGQIWWDDFGAAGSEVFFSSDNGNNSSSYDTNLPLQSRKITYGGPSIDPGVLNLADLSGENFSVTVTSNTITMAAGMTQYRGVWAGNGAEVSISSGGGWQTGDGSASITGGEQLQLRMVSAPTPDTEKTSTVRIGPQRTEWTVQTMDQMDLYIADSPNVTEGGTASFVVSLASTAVTDVTFDWVTVDGSATEADSDYAAVTTAIAGSIITGQSQITIAVATTQDLQFETDEDFFVSLSNVSAAGNLVDALGVASIINDDSITINFNIAGSSFDEGASGSDADTQFETMEVGEFHVCAVGANQSLFCWGGGPGPTGAMNLGIGTDLGDFSIPMQVSLGNGTGSYKQVSVNYGQTCAVGTDGELYCWGSNLNGELGISSVGGLSVLPEKVTLTSAEASFQEVSVGSTNVCALGASGSIYCWGQSGPKLGMDGLAGDVSFPMQVSLGDGPAAYKKIASGNTAVCGLGIDDQLYCWGSDTFGQLGRGALGDSSIPVQVSLGESSGKYVDISIGIGSACALGEDQRAYCWGWNSTGNLGVGDNINRAYPSRVLNGEGPGFYKSISAAPYIACAVGVDEKVYCWGTQIEGRVGNGENSGYVSSPVAISLGTGPGTYKSVDVGSTGSCAMGTDNKIYCWGRGSEGQLGNGTIVTESTVPVAVSDGANTGGIFLPSNAGAEVLLVLSAYSPSPITVPFTVGGTSTPGADHDLPAGSFTISGNSQYHFGKFSIVDDLLVEGDETINITLGAPSQGVIGSQASHTVTIIDNDTAIDLFIADSANVTEGGTASFVVSLASSAVTDVTFDWVTVEGTATELDAFGETGDYSAVTVATSVTIATGAIQVTLSVSTNDDLWYEPATEQFDVSLSNVSNSATIVAGLGRASIISNDSVSDPIFMSWLGSHILTSDDMSTFVFVDLSGVTVGVGNDMTYCNGNWVGVGDDRLAIHSTDGLNWVNRDLSSVYNPTHNLRTADCINGRVFVAAQSATNNTAYSDDYGATWVAITDDLEGSGADRFTSYRGDVYYPRFDVSLVARSTDGGSSFFGVDWYDGVNGPMGLASEGDRQVIVRSTGDAVYYSDDQFATSNTIPIAGGGNNQREPFLLDGRLYGGRGGYTDDFSSWNGSGYTTALGLWFGNGVLYAGGSNGRLYASSDRGASFPVILNLGLSGQTIKDPAYGGPSIEPDNLSFADLTDQATSTFVSSELITLSGMTAYQYVYASPGVSVQVNGGGWVDNWGVASVTGGDTLQLGLTTASAMDTDRVATVRIANLKKEWVTTTLNQAQLFVVDSPAVVEGNSAEFIVSLSFNAPGDVTFDWTTVDGSAISIHRGQSTGDYFNVFDSATIAGGERSDHTLCGHQ